MLSERRVAAGATTCMKVEEKPKMESLGDLLLCEQSQESN